MWYGPSTKRCISGSTAVPPPTACSESSPKLTASPASVLASVIAGLCRAAAGAVEEDRNRRERQQDYEEREFENAHCGERDRHDREVEQVAELLAPRFPGDRAE